MAFKILRLDAERLGLMRDINALFAEAFEDEQHYASKKPSDAYVQRLLERPSFIALAALEGDKVIGALAAYELPKFEQERSEVYIYDLAVAESHRRRGVATALIEETVLIAKACGAWVVYVQADHDDEPPIALYTKLGVREDVLHFDIPVR